MHKDSHRTDSSRPQQVTASVDGSGTCREDDFLPLVGHELGKALISVCYFFPSLFSFFGDRVLLCSPGWPGTYNPHCDS